LQKEASKDASIKYSEIETKSQWRKQNITINAPLILKMRDIIFFAGKLYNGPFQGIFQGGQKSRGPLEISREMAHYVVCPKNKKNIKIMSQIFKISCALVFLCPFATRAPICKRFSSPEIDSEECPLRITASKILIANDTNPIPAVPLNPVCLYMYLCFRQI
jgi:hypothetical protein